MALSIEEAGGRFADLAAAAARGERVIVTKHGRPFVELVAAREHAGMDFQQAAKVLRELGLDDLHVEVPPNFDDPAFRRHVLGLIDWGCCSTPTSPSGRRSILTL